MPPACSPSSPAFLEKAAKSFSKLQEKQKLSIDESKKHSERKIRTFRINVFVKSCSNIKSVGFFGTQRERHCTVTFRGEKLSTERAKGTSPQWTGGRLEFKAATIDELESETVEIQVIEGENSLQGSVTFPSSRIPTEGKLVACLRESFDFDTQGSVTIEAWVNRMNC